MTNIETVLFADTELMDSMLQPQVTEDDVRFAEVNLKTEIEWEDETDFTSLEELSRQYQFYGPPRDDSFWSIIFLIMSTIYNFYYK